MRTLLFLLITVFVIGCNQTINVATPPQENEAEKTDDNPYADMPGWNGTPYVGSIETEYKNYFSSQERRNFESFPTAPRLEAIQSWKEVSVEEVFPTVEEFEGRKIVEARKVIFEVVANNRLGTQVTNDIVLLFYNLYEERDNGYKHSRWHLIRGNSGHELN